jgi:hypothetical protein
VAHHHGTRVLALYLAFAAVVSLAGYLWPVLCGALLVLIVSSALVDMDGGRGWVRGLSLAKPAYNLIAWPEPKPDGPTLVILAPLDEAPGLQQVSTSLLCAPLFLMLTALVGIVLRPFADDLGTTMMLSAAALLMLGSCLTLAWGVVRAKRGENNPARATLEQTMTLLEREPSPRLSCVFALIGGGSTLHDGVEVFLKNHEHLLPPGRARVLVVHPHHDVLGVVPLEGRVRPKHADAKLLNPLREQGLQPRRATTSAARAMRLGWPAAAITVGPDQINAGAQAIVRLVQTMADGLPPEPD